MEEFEFEEATANLDDMVNEFQQCGPGKKDSKDTLLFSVLEGCVGVNIYATFDQGLPCV